MTIITATVFAPAGLAVLLTLAHNIETVLLAVRAWVLARLTALAAHRMSDRELADVGLARGDD